MTLSSVMGRVKEVEGRHVTKLCFQPDLTLVLEDAEELQRNSGVDEGGVTAILGGSIVVQREGGEERLLKSVPGERTYHEMDRLVEYRFIHEACVRECLVEGDGTLIFKFDQGTLKILPFDEAESWQMYSDKGFRMICMPGGDVAVWSEDSSPFSPSGDGASV